MVSKKEGKMAIERKPKPFYNLTPEEAQYLDRRLAFEKCKDVHKEHIGEQYTGFIQYKPVTEGIPTFSYPYPMVFKLFTSAEKSFEADKRDLGLNDNDWRKEWGKLMRGEIEPVVLPPDPSIDPDGHKFSVNKHYYICRLHDPPVIKWKKEL